MADWFTTEGATPEEATAAQERLLDAWPEAPLDRLEVCTMLLEVAREQVIAYAPDPGTAEASVAAVLERFALEHKLIDVLAVLELDTLTDPPRRYVYAQLQQAAVLWNAGRTAPDGSVGDGAFMFTPRPLDKTIRAIIRPADGKPHVL
jgi:hypothetical protein